MSDSVESKVVQKCTSELEMALNEPETGFVHFLREKGFINENIADRILNPKASLDDDQKARTLVRMIKNRIKLDAMSYHTLLNEFKRRGAFYSQL